MRRKAGILTAALLMVSAIKAAAISETERIFIWNEANSRLAAASAPEEFLRAAETYGKLVRAGVRNGPLFFNLGTALLKARRYEAALNALLRAERYMGTNAEIKRNMVLAIAGAKNDDNTSLPWSRFVLFWHYGLAGGIRMTVAAAAFSACWLALAMRRLGARNFANQLLTISLLILILFGSSVATTLHQEAKADLRDPIADFGVKARKM